MPYTVHAPQPFFAAIVARLVASTGKQIGLAEAPGNTTYPYAVVDPLTDESQEGALSDPSQIVVWAWRVRCISNVPDGAQIMQRLARTALHGHIPVVAGLGTTPIHMVDGSGLIRDDAVQPPLFFTSDLFTAFTSI